MCEILFGYSLVQTLERERSAGGIQGCRQIRRTNEQWKRQGDENQGERRHADGADFHLSSNIGISGRRAAVR